MPNTKPVGVAFSDPELVSGTTITGATISGGTLTGSTTISGAAVIGTTSVTASGDLYIASATVAAAGANQGAAAQLAGGFSLVTGADDAKGVKLPAAVAGRICIVKNAVSNKALLVYPATSDKINGGTATTGTLSLTASTIAMFIAYDDVDWYSLPLLPS
jgi:hypothetical protein